MNNFIDYLYEDLKDPSYAITYLKTALKLYDQDQELGPLLTAIRDVVEASKKGS